MSQHRASAPIPNTSSNSDDADTQQTNNENCEDDNDAMQFAHSEDEIYDGDTYHCKSCDIQFESLEDHIRDYHEAQEVVIQDDRPSESRCTLCSYRFTSIVDRDMHMQVQHDVGDSILEKDLFPVSLAKATKTATTVQLKSNPDEILPAKSLTYCEVCNTTFPSVKSIKLHKRMHLPVRQITIEKAMLCDEEAITPDVPETFHCSTCDKKYGIEFQTIHELSHTDVSKALQHRCTICNIQLETSQLLKMHQAAHNERTYTVHDRGDKPLPYVCTYCGKAFARPHEKVKHERIHTGEKPHACEICGKTFRVAFCLTLHMRTHTNARPYVCSLCSKRFKSHSVYNHHLQTHSDERPYQCPFCPKAFKTAVQAAGHKNSHTKPFPCAECNRPFSTLYAVKAHMRNGHNLMKHVCHVCGASYTRAFALKNHLKEKHADVPDTVVVVDKSGGGVEKACKKGSKPTAETVKIEEEDRSDRAQSQLQFATDSLININEDESIMCKEEGQLLMSDGGSMLDGIIIEVSEEIVVDWMK